MLLISSISSGFEEIPAFCGVEEFADVADGGDEIVVGSGADAPQMGLELCEGELDGVQVRTVRRQEEEPGAALSEGLGGAGALVCAEVVEDDDGAGLEQGASWVST